MLVNQIMQLKPMDFQYVFKKLQTYIKVTRIIMIFQCFSSAHTADLNKTDNDYNTFLVFSVLKSLQELVRASKR